MAEEGIEDYALAKRKAARRLGLSEGGFLPRNEEIESELRVYRSIYQAEEHARRTVRLRRVALDAMQALSAFNPYLTGPVLKGTAGPHAEIELQLFPESAKDVEVFLLDRAIPYSVGDAAGYSGAKKRSASVFRLEWQGEALRLLVFDPRDERVSLRGSAAGKPLERATESELRQLIKEDEAAAP